MPKFLFFSEPISSHGDQEAQGALCRDQPGIARDAKRADASAESALRLSACTQFFADFCSLQVACFMAFCLVLARYQQDQSAPSQLGSDVAFEDAAQAHESTKGVPHWNAEKNGRVEAEDKKKPAPESSTMRAAHLLEQGKEPFPGPGIVSRPEAAVVEDAPSEKEEAALNRAAALNKVEAHLVACVS